MLESPAFRSFRESLDPTHTDRRWADDFDLGALAVLAGDERRQAEQILLDWLAAHPGDDRAAPALARLGSARAVAPLHAALATADGSLRIRTAKALATLDPPFDAVPHCLAVLAHGDTSARALAAVALAGNTHAHVLSALRAALRDENQGLRLCAYQSLVDTWQLFPLHRPLFSPLREIGAMLGAGNRAVWSLGAEALEGIVDGLAAGRRPDELGLHDGPPEPHDDLRRLASELRDRTSSSDLGGLEHLAGPTRRAAETLLLCELTHDDPRVPRALARIGTARAVAALQEALGQPCPRSQADLQRALEALAGRAAR